MNMQEAAHDLQWVPISNVIGATRIQRLRANGCNRHEPYVCVVVVRFALSWNHESKQHDLKIEFSLERAMVVVWHLIS